MVCAAGGWLLLVLGCVPESFMLSADVKAAPAEHTQAGTLENVSVSAQSALRRLGLSVTATREGEDVRLASVTPSGKRFFLVLSRLKSPTTEQTRVRIEWQDKERDDHFWFQLLSLLVSPPADSVQEQRPAPAAPATSGVQP
jgi:hypothetical protein